MNPSQIALDKANHKDAFPQELREFSEKVEQEKLKQVAQHPETKNRFFGDGFYASPIIALNRRDLQALADFFHRDDMADIELDLLKLLKLILPDFYKTEQKLDHSFQVDPAFDFLQEYL